MARPLWNGSISFGLVTIPVGLYPAIRADEGIHFHLLHAKDESRVRNVHVCEADGKEVPYKDLVRGYEYEKGKYVVVTDAELKSHRPEQTQTVEIRSFVEASEIDPMLFDTPYYLVPEKKGRHAYALLRDALKKSERVGIAQVVLHTRAHVAAVRPVGDALVLDLLHYGRELRGAKELDLPAGKEKATDGEVKAAKMLIDAMAKPFDADEYEDEYTAGLKAMLMARAKGKAPAASSPGKGIKAATNVVDLVEVLKRSLEAKKGAKPKSAPAKKSPAKRAAARG